MFRYGSPNRGSVPIGWTFSPAIADISPVSGSVITQALTDQDELVAGPSGYGYMYPTEWPAADLQAFTELTLSGMQRLGMNTCNLLGQNDDPPLCSQVTPLLTPDGVDGLVYYPFGGGYSALNGQVFWCDTDTENGVKPLVSGRFSLWGNGTSGEMVGVDGLIQQLIQLPKAPITSSDAYSLIPVNAWSHTYDDVVAVVQGLEDAGGFDIVLPTELLRRIRANVDH